VRKLLCTLACFINFVSLDATAAYNANIQSELKHVGVYTDGDYIYITLKNQPSTHPTCKPNYFVVADDVPEQRRQIILSRLLAAYAMKETVNIGYDNAGSCAHGYIRVHEVG
jgi:hypothetical protein